MLPEIKRRLKGILAGKKLADSLREEIERFSPLVFEVPGARQKNDQVDSIVKNVMEGISELEDLGVKLRDIDTGLLDFPAKRFDEVVYLCWRYGESSIEFWHRQNEGFGSRKHLRPDAEPSA